MRSRTLMVALLRPARTHALPWTRQAVFLSLVLLLLWQLFALTQHHHDLTAQDDDCPACVLTLHYSGPGQDIQPVLPRVGLVLNWVLPALAPLRQRIHLPFSFLAPLPLAPPCQPD